MSDFEDRLPKWNPGAYDERTGVEMHGKKLDKGTVEILENVLNDVCGYLLVDTCEPGKDHAFEHYLMNGDRSSWMRNFVKYIPLFVQFFLEASNGDMEEMQYLLGKYWKNSLIQGGSR